MASGFFGKLFGTGKKQEPEKKRVIPRSPMAPLTRLARGDDGKCTCIFCGKSFSPEDVDFAYQYSGEEGCQDETFKRFVKEFNNYPVDKLPSRRIVKYSAALPSLDVDDIIPSSREGDPLPAGIRVDEGLLSSVRRESGPRRRSYSRFALDDEDQRDSEQSSSPQLTGRKITCMTRLCPNCHSELPDGYFDIFNIRIGFMGGRRSGKTSYITTAAQVLNDRLLELKLGSCTILPESRIMLEDMTNSLKRSGGKMTATVRTDGAKPVFPVVMLISPLSPDYPAFFLTLLDIPGEYMDGNTNNIAGDPVSLSNELIAVIDPHMFMDFPDDTAQGEMNEFNSDGYHDIFGKFPSSIADSLRNVRSVQVMVTKLDLIQKYAEENPEFAGTLSGFQDVWDNHYEWFYQSIDGERLESASYNAGLLVQQISHDRRQSNLMDMADYIDQKMLSARRQINIGCSLISSQDTTSGEYWYNSRAVFDQSVGVLDPLMRIFFWEHLLP